MLRARKNSTSNTRQAVLFSLVLILASFFTLAHASQHHFHTGDLSCSAFLSVENNNGLGNTCADLHEERHLFMHDVVPGPQLVCQLTLLPYSSRAPPAF
ncbi:MAG: hypothetical protein ABF326_02640 [Arenicellales bacterium]